MANNRIAVLVALEGADDGLKRALNSAQQSLGELSARAKTAGQKAAAGMAEVKAGMSAFGDQVSSAKTQLLAFLSINWAADQLKHWKRGTTMFRELRARGASVDVAKQVVANSRRWWRNSDRLLNTVLTIAYIDGLGVPRLLEPPDT